MSPPRKPLTSGGERESSASQAGLPAVMRGGSSAALRPHPPVSAPPLSMAVSSPLSSAVSLEWTAALGALVVLATLTPLGLSSGEAVDQVAQAFGARRSLAEATPLADTLVRLFALAPLGEAGSRAHLVAALLGAAGVALLLARARMVAAPRVPSRLGLATVVGVVLLTLSRPFLEIASVRSAAALDLCLLAAGALLLEVIRRAPTRSSVGLALAFVCGLAAGAGWSVRAALWPLALVLTIWALRRGERWPLLAPTLFIAGAAITLAAAAGAQLAPVTTAGRSGAAGLLLHRVLIPELAAPVQLPLARELLAWVIDDAGVLALLAGLLGWALLWMRAPTQALTLLLPWGTAVAATLAMGNVLLSRLFIVASLMAPVTVAVSVFAGSFGRARAAVVLVLLVVVVVPPAMVGVGAALAQPAHRNPAAVARRLDVAFETAAGPPFEPPALPIASATGQRDQLHGPGEQVTDQEAMRWWRYGTAIGLLAPRASTVPLADRGPHEVGAVAAAAGASQARADARGQPPHRPPSGHGLLTPARPILAPR